jgi:hypothetical protein
MYRLILPLLQQDSLGLLWVRTGDTLSKLIQDRRELDRHTGLLVSWKLGDRRPSKVRPRVDVNRRRRGRIRHLFAEVEAQLATTSEGHG